MEAWTALSQKELMMELFVGEQHLDTAQAKLWEKVKIRPEVWTCVDVIEANFWVVGRTEKWIIWYNDIEEGFNLSSYIKAGEILHYKAFRHELQVALTQLENA